MNIEKLCRVTDAFLPRLFLVIAVPMVLFFALFVPPFQVPDEYTHLLRADQISYGELVGTRLDAQNSGGKVETAYRLLHHIFPEQTGITKEMLSAAALPLTGQREFQSFPNTSQYGPVLYVPQAAALGFARLIGLNALQAFTLARCCNGLVALVLGFLALLTARRGRFLMFCMLTMPMSLFLMGSLSQDALLLSGSALFLSVVSKNVATGRTPSFAMNIGLVVLLTALAWGRLPCLLLGVVFLLKPHSDMRWGQRVFPRGPGLVALALVLALVGLWGVVIRDVQITLRPLVSVQEQGLFLRGHLSLIPQIALNSLKGPDFLFTFGGLFGSLGVFNSKLPLFFYPIALAGMLGALLLETTQESGFKAFDRAVIACALFCGVGAVYLALYLTWTPVGQLSVEGVQGRYLLPFVLGSALALPTAAPHFRKLFYSLVLLLPPVAMIGAVVSVRKIIGFYN